MSSLTVDENVAWLPEDIERTPKEDIYSGVVHGSCTLGFHFGKNEWPGMCRDVGNAFLYGKTREKVFVIAGEEFGKTLAKEWL
jgi:hypothetical protein